MPLFIHLGEDEVIKTDEVIAIFNYEIFKENETNTHFIENIIAGAKLIDVGVGETKSVVITHSCIYYSPFSPNTLKKRSQLSL